MKTVTYPFPVKHFTVHNGVDIAYCDEGKGEQTILFIHGLGNYLPVWKHLVSALKEQYRCIAIDLPGNGLSSRGAYPYSMFFYAECVVKLIEELRLKRVTLCGHSMGGQIAIVISIRYPHLFDKLVLVAPAGLEHFSPHEVAMMQQMMTIGDFFQSDEYHLESTIRSSFYKHKQEDDHIISDLKKIMKGHAIKEWRDMCTASVNGMLNEQVSQFLPQVSCPALIIFGKQDQLIPNRLIHLGETPETIGKYGEAMIPVSTLLMVAAAGHFVQLEKPAEVNKAIRDFLG